MSHGLTLAELWLIAGALLVAAEIVAPGFFLMWVGGAAMVTGFAAWAFALTPEVAMLTFAIVAVAMVFAAKSWLPYNAAQSPNPLLNKRAAQLIGQTVVVVEAVSLTSGRIKVRDGVWPARGCDAAVDARVKITGTDGNTLIVENA